MKKIIKYIIIFIFITALFPTIAKAENIYNESYFNGSIVQKYKFMPGDILEPDDFIIDGTMITSQSTYDSESLSCYIPEAKYNSPVAEDEEITFEVVVFVKENREYSCRVPVTVNYTPFDPKVNSQLENKTFTIDKIHWKSEDGFDTFTYIDEIDKRVLNTQGKEIKGELRLSGKANAPSLGYNTVTYRFKPHDNRYDVLYGEFTVIYEREPYMVVKQDFINIHLPESKYKVYLNGKLQKDHFIDELKPNTKYKIVVKQKNTKIGKNITVWEGTVRTKK